MKYDFITAYTWLFDTTKKQANLVYKQEKSKGNLEYIQTIITCFKDNAKRCFYTD